MARNYIRKLHEDDKKRKRNEQPNLMERINQVAMIGLGVGAGVALFKSGAFKTGSIKAASFLGDALSEADTFASALGKTAKSKGVIGLLGKDAKQEFIGHYAKGMNTLTKNKSLPTRGMGTRIEEAVFQLNNHKRRITESYDATVRAQEFVKELKDKNALETEYIDKIAKTLEKDKSWRNTRHRYDIDGLNKYLKRNKLEIDEDKSGDFLEMFNRYKSSDLEDVIGVDGVKAFNAHIDKLYSNVEAAAVEGLKKESGDISKLFKTNSNWHAMTNKESIDRGVFAKNTRYRLPENKVENYTVNGQPRVREKLTGRMKIMDMDEEVRALIGRHNEVADFISDPGLFTNGQDIKDVRQFTKSMQNTLTFMSNEFKIPFLGINPLKLLHWNTIEGSINAPIMTMFKAGTKQMAVTGDLDDLAGDMVFSGKKVFDITSGELVKDNVSIVPGQYGLHKRTYENMAGVSTKQASDNPFIAWAQETFDITLQEPDNEAIRKLQGWTKFRDENWFKNKFRLIRQGHIGDEGVKLHGQEFLDETQRIVENNAKPLSDRAMSELTEYTKQDMPYLFNPNTGNPVVDLSMSTKEDTISILTRIASNYKETPENHRSRTVGRLMSEFTQYEANPKKFMDGTVILNQSERNIFGVTTEQTNMVPRWEKSKILIQQEIVSTIGRNFDTTSTDDVARLVDSGKFSLETVEELKKTQVATQIQRYSSDVFNAKTEEDRVEALKNYVGWVQGNALTYNGARDEWGSKLSDTLNEMIGEYVPVISPGKASPPKKAFGDVEYLGVNRNRNAIKTSVDILTNGGSMWDALNGFAKDSIGQLGLGPRSIRAGRDNMGDITNATVGAYYSLFRVNEALSRVGFGMSPKNMGSLQDTYTNLMLRRLIYPALAIGAVGYLNYEAGNILGKKPSDMALDAGANMRQDMAAAKDFLGITNAYKSAVKTLPGIEQLEESPVGMVASALTFGLIGDSKNEEEVEAENTWKDVPYRKGRYWSLNNMPWRGQGIAHYAPNAYRLARSGYKYTDVQYGSEGEFWAHSWLPNPRNLFGLTPLLDPNHWSDKHKEDRPYPTTGGYEILRQLPIAGPVLDATVGNVLNPTRTRSDLGKAHREYLKDINENIKAAMSQQARGGYAYFAPGGGIEIVGQVGETRNGGIVIPGDNDTPGGIIDLKASATAATNVPLEYGISGNANGYPTLGDGINQYDTSRYVPQGIISTGIGFGGETTREKIKAINDGTTSANATVSSDAFRSLQNVSFVNNIKNVPRYSDLGIQLGESYHSAVEMGGMYGFLTESTIGDGKTNEPVLAHGRMIESARRAFWDKNLGGIGGELSEIGRRFFPKEVKYDYYNPYRNTQPGWMPGCFLAGTKVLTSKGYMDIDKLRISDKVLTHTGKFMPVQWVNERQYTGNFVTLTVDGISEKITSTQDHPYLVMSTSRCSTVSGPCVPLLDKNSTCDKCKNAKYSELKWIPASQIKEGDYVVEAFPNGEEYVNSVPINRITNLPRLFKKDMPLNWTTGIIVGAWIAKSKDGIDNSLELCYNYKDTILDFCYAFNIKPKFNLKTISMDDQQIIEWLKLHFKNNILPSWIYDAPAEFKIGLIASYIDLNSFYSLSKRIIQIIDPVKGLHQLFGTIGIFLKQYVDKINLFTDDIYRIRMLSGAFGKLFKFIFEQKQQKRTPYNGEFVLHKVEKTETVNDTNLVYNLQVGGDHTYNVYGIAVHNSHYFIDFQHGDPYSKIQLGEARLPGAGYEALNSLNPDRLFGKYGVVDRLKILGNTAPYSSEYKYYDSIASMMNQSGMLTVGQKEIIETTREQVASAKRPFELYDYKFKYSDIKKRDVTVKYVIDNNTFVTEEYPLHPIRLAGIQVPNNDSETALQAKEMLNKTIFQGAKIKIGIDNDALNRTSGDTYESIRAVVYDNENISIQRKLAQMSVMGGNDIKVKEGVMSPADIAAVYSPRQMAVGKAWENIAHLDTYFHTRFLNVRSGVEMYERRDVYGKSFQSWANPIGDFLIPTLQSYARHNPLVSAGLGALMGYLFGAKKTGRIIGATVGGTITAAMSSYRTFEEVLGGDKRAAIPARRRKEREVNEYFDKLKYIKFRGLYEKTADLAKKQEGVNLKELIAEESSEKGKKNRNLINSLEQKKKLLKLRMTDPLVYEERAKEQIEEINDNISEIRQDKKLVRLGPLAMQALRYRDESESTLFGMDEIDYNKVYKALPKRERNYFQSFINAPPEEREKILKLIPENQRRIFQGVWGMQQDEKENLDDFFSSHYLPDDNWEGWRPDVSLEAVKVKTMAKEGVDLRDNSVWDEDPVSVRQTQAVPRIKTNMGSFMNPNRLRDILKGAGLRDVDVRYAYGPANDANTIAINMESEKDIRKEFANYINDRGL